MTRIVNSGNDTALQGDAVIACIMVDLDFASGHVYAHDGIGEIQYNGHTFLGLGTYGGLDAVDETLDGTPRPVKLILSGVDASLVTTAQNEIYKNRSATVYLAARDSVSGKLVDIPETIWEGRMNKMTITLDKKLGSIALTCENRLRREPRIARYTDADQQQANPGDTFWSFQEQLLGFVAQWGNDKVGYDGPKLPPGTGMINGWPIFPHR